MSFFDQVTMMNKYTLEENLLYQFPWKYNVYYIYQRICPNGGLVLITDDFTSIETSRPHKNELLEKYIIVLAQDGEIIAKIPRSTKIDIIGIEFLKDERILVVLKNGMFQIYNPYESIPEDQNKILQNCIPNLIPYSAFFDLKNTKMNSEYELNFIKTYGDSFLVITKKFHFFLIFNIYEETPQRKQISLEGFQNMNFTQFNQNSIEYYIDLDKKTFIFYFACLEKGIMRISFDKSSEKLNYQIIGNEIQGKPLELLLSLNESRKKNLAVLSGDYIKSDIGEGYDLNRVNILDIKESEIKDFSVQELNLSNEEKRDYQGLYWFGTKGLVMQFKKTLKFITNKESFFMMSQYGLTSNSLRLFCQSEIDGVKVIAINNQTQTAYNIMVRNTPTEYMNVKENEICLSPVKKLTECYLSYIEGKCPKQMEIIDNPLEIQIALKELRTVIQFEMDKNEQKKYLQAISFGKLFLNGEQNQPTEFKKYVIDIAQNLKVWLSIREKTNRPMTYAQYEYFLKTNEENFVQLLINKQQFQEAFNLFHSQMIKSKNLNKIFIEYTKRLLDKVKKIRLEIRNDDLDKQLQAQCAQKILTTFKKCLLFSNKVKSSILIDLANLALQEQMNGIADALLKEENPIILKIQTYLKMKKPEKAFEQAIKAQNSNALYLSFDKLYQNGDFSANFLNSIKEQDSLIQDHFYRYLKLKNHSQLQKITNPLRFFLENCDENINPNQMEQILTETLQKDFKNQTSYSMFWYAKDYLQKYKEYQESPKYKSLSSQLNLYDLIKSIFLEKKEDFISKGKLYSDDSEIKKIENLFKLEQKQLCLFQLKFMLEQNAGIKEIGDFLIAIKKHKLTIFQIQVMFNKFEKQEQLADVLCRLDFNPTYDQCVSRQLYFEAAKLALVNRKKNEFEKVIRFVKPETLRVKLEKEFKQLIYFSYIVTTMSSKFQILFLLPNIN